jgi:hypothetical protein
MSRARDKANSTVSNFASTGIDDNADANAITIDSSEKVGIGDTSPLGNKVHIRTAGSATSVNGDAGLVLESDDSTRCDLQFMGPDGAFQSVYFGDVSDDNRGIIAYSHSGNNMRFTVDASERMRLTSDGLTFNGDTASANALSDFETGSFTPTAEGNTTAGTGTYLYQVGSYVKVGSLVQFQLNMQWSSHSGSGVVLVKGLPFTSKNTTNLFSVGSMYASGLPISSNHRAMPFMLPNRTYFNVNQENGSGGASSVNIDSAAQILLTGVYRTDA